MVARLAAEGHPPPALFRILPWELVDRLADQVTAMLGGAAPLQVIALRHWFTPVGSRFTAALEQLDEGLRDQDPAIIRVRRHRLVRAPAGSGCIAVADADPPGAGPAGHRAAVGQRFPRVHGGEGGRLTRDGDAGELRPLHVGTRLPAAADTQEEIRTRSRDMLREPFTVRLTVTATGRAAITVSARLPDDQLPWVTGAYGVMVVPVRVTAAAGSTRYLLPLRHLDGEVSGRLNIAAPLVISSRPTWPGPPIGADEASLLDMTEVERSIRALRTRSDRDMWRQLGALLPSAHPLRAVIAREAG